MKCSKCNQENPEGAKFCTECGEKIFLSIEPKKKEEIIDTSNQAIIKESFKDQPQTKIRNIKSDFRKVADDSFVNLLEKTKALKKNIASGKYKKILDTEIIKKTLDWFRISYERLRLLVYFGWAFAVYLMIGLFIGLASAGKGGAGNIIAVPFITIFMAAWGGLVMGFYAFSIGYLATYSKLGDWVIGNIAKIPIISWIFVGIPIYVFCKPSDWLYDKYFSKYSYYDDGWAYCNQGEYEKALERFNKFKVGKKDATGYAFLYQSQGVSYFEMGKYGNAIDAFKRSIDHETNDFPKDERYATRTYLGHSFRLNRNFNEALKIYRSLIQQEAEDALIHASIADCYLNLDMYKEAMTALSEAIRLEPQNPVFHKLMAEVYLGLGDDENAVKEATLALKLNPTNDVAEQAQEIINYIQYGPDKEYVEEEQQRIPETIGLASSAIASDKQHEDISSIIDNEREINAIDQKDLPAETLSFQDLLDDVSRKLFCVNPNCKKEIPQDSVFCGYCGTKVVQS